MTIKKTLIATALLAMAQPALAQDSDDSIEISFKGDTVAGEPVIYQRHQERMSQGVVKSASLNGDALASLDVVDVAVFYSPVLEDMLGTQEIVRRVDFWFEEINQGMRQSGTSVYYNPVFVKPFVFDVRDDPLAGSCEPIADCTNLLPARMEDAPYLPMIDPESTIDEAGMTAAQFGADLSLYIQESSDYDIENGPLGTAGVFRRTSRVADLTIAPTVVERDLVDNAMVSTARTIMHELGHNFGLQHQFNRAEGWENTEAEEYSFAWQCGQGDEHSRATALWATTKIGFETLNLLSNPDIMRHDEACGDPQEADQTRAVNEYAETVASLDDRPVATADVSFDKDKYTVLAGQDELLVNVTRSGDTSEYAEVQVVTHDGGAKEGEDFLFSGSIVGDGESHKPSGAVVKFQPGEATSFATIDLTNVDTSVTKAFTVSLRFPLKLNTNDVTALVELQGDNGPASSGTVNVEKTNYLLPENDEQEVTLTRSGDLSHEAVVKVESVDGTGVAGQNYFPVDRFVHFLPGEETAAFTVRSGETDDVSTFRVNVTSPMDVSIEQPTIDFTVKSGKRGLATFPLQETGELDYPEGLCIDDMPEDGVQRHYDDEHICGFQMNHADDTLTYSVDIERIGGSTGELEVNVFYVSEDYLIPDQYNDAGELVDVDDRMDFVDGSHFDEHGFLPEEMLSWSTKTVTFADGETSKAIDIEVTDLPQYAEQDGYQFMLEIEADRLLQYTYKAGAINFRVEQASMPDNDGGDDDNGGGDDNIGGGNPNDGNTDSGGTSGGSTSLLFLGLLSMLGLRRIVK
ncbi:Calx-beta domain-containing protein [Idiomarina loihiensis]|uniref:Calx-beta domain-containing protein n=1 Tax=Idiomarina loihiensis TaxID=135577 RepID=UPI00384FF139